MTITVTSVSSPAMDIHCHGAYEFDTNDANEEGLRYWAEHIVSEGVTVAFWLPPSPRALRF